MIHQSRRIGLLLVTAISLVNCSNSKQVKRATESATLRNTFKDDFLIGTAMNVPQIEQRDAKAAALIPQQFDAVTPENIMKAEEIHPQWNTYRFDIADKLVAYAATNNIRVNAHTLIWHSQLPAYVRRLQSADSLRQFFTEHINTIASRYDGKVYSWDVVNEALNEDGTLRNSIFLQKLGDNYIVDAFRLAQKASPHSELYYNDYNIEQPKKRAGAISVVQKIQAAGVRIDGIGIQGHWRSGHVPFDEIEKSIVAFGALGIKVMFTELDLSVLPNPLNGNTADVNQTAAYNTQYNPFVAGLPDLIQQQLASDYEQLFKLFLKHKDKIGRVTFWGVNDGQSWLNNWPVRGRTNYPLLFDRQFAPKLAYYKVIETKTKS